MMITIHRKLAVINGFVEIPNSKIQSKTLVDPDAVISTIDGTKRSRLTESGGRPRNNMNFISFPGFKATDGYPSDWFGTLIG